MNEEIDLNSSIEDFEKHVDRLKKVIELFECEKNYIKARCNRMLSEKNSEIFRLKTQLKKEKKLNSEFKTLDY